MKNFTLTLSVFLSARQLKQMPATLVLLLITSLLPAKLLAQAPAISYSSPQVYTTGTAITTLSPVVSGTVAPPGYNSAAVTFASGLLTIDAVAADKAGNVYVSAVGNGGTNPPAVYKIPAGGGSPVSIGSGFIQPRGLAVDHAGNVYVAEPNAIKKISVSDGSTTVVATGFNDPFGLAVDTAGNIYVAGGSTHQVSEIRAADGSVITIGSGFSTTTGVAVDAAGNVYVDDSGNNAVKEILAGVGNIILLASGSNYQGLALDGAGNIYFSDFAGNKIEKIEQVQSGLLIIAITASTEAIALDGAGNLYYLQGSNVFEVKPTGGYYISPSLPAGLSFDGTTGAISGTPIPTAVGTSPATNYTVTAYNSAGSGQATLNLTVKPLILTYSSPQVYTTGTAITALAPVVTGTVAAQGYSSAAVTFAGGFSSSISGLAADAAGNIYVANQGNGGSIPPVVYKIQAGGGSPVSIGSGFIGTAGLAVDGAGNVYVADGFAGAIKKIAASDGSTTIVAAGFSNPGEIAVDAAGNIYVADINNIKKILAADKSVITVGPGFTFPAGVAVDAMGNVYVSDPEHQAVKEIPAGGGSIVTLASGSSYGALRVDAAGNIYVCDGGNFAIDEIPAGGTIEMIAHVAAQDVALDGSGNLYFEDPLSNTVDELKPTGGYYINPFLPAGLNFNSTTGVISGTPTVASPATNYTVTAYNSGGSNQATLNLTVNLAPPTISYSSPQTYIAGAAITALAPVSTGVAAWGYNNSAVNIGSGLVEPVDVAADAAGNVYVADLISNHIVKIPAGNGTPVTLAAFTTPFGIAVDAAGNVYVAAASAGVILEVPAGGGAVNPIGSGFSAPSAVAVDHSGNLYVADAGNGALKEVPAGNGTPVTIKSGFANIQGVAVDAAGNVYVADAGVGTSGNGAVYKIPAGGGAMVSVGAGFSRPSGVVTDAAGNLYISDINKTVITVIEPNGTQFTIGSGFSLPNGVAIDGLGNVYIADSGNGKVKEVKMTGGYFLSQSLPAGLIFNNSTGTISGTPTSTSPATNYTVTGYNITGSSTATVNITVDPLLPPVISYSTPQTYVTGTAITPLSPVNTGGTVAAQDYNSAAVTFANLSLPLSGIATDAAGNIYAAITNGSQSAVYKIPAGGGSPASIGLGFGNANGLTVDYAGSVYVSDIATGSVKKIAASNGSTTTIASGFNNPRGLAVDAAGNIYVADQSNNAVKEIPVAGGSVISVGSGFSSPTGVAIDAAGNIYIADFGNKALKEIPAGGGAIATLASGFLPTGLTVDAAGNIFVTDLTNLVIDEIPAGGTIKTIANVHALNIAVDGAGNLYTTDASAGNTAIITYKPTGGYYISRFLPAGLNFNGVTGVISGTPTAGGGNPATNYTVTAYNSMGSSAATLNIKVNPLISYASPQVYTAGTAITALAPVVNGTVAPQAYNSAAVTFAGGFFTVNGIAADAAGNIYVADNVHGPGTSVVYKIPAGGGSAINIGGGFNFLSGLAIDRAGNVYVVDVGNFTVKKIAASDGSITNFIWGLFNPTGVAVDAAGNVYVTDSNNNAVKEKLAADGSVITIGSGFNNPLGIAVDAAGNVYVADSGNKAVKEIPAGGGSIITLASGSAFSALALDAAGNIYVTDLINNVIDEIPAGGTIKTIANVLSTSITLDGAGNLYYATGSNFVDELKPTGGYYIGPFLPAGLNFNSTTGVISGTPTASSPAANYTVTAYNGAISGTAKVRIKINPASSIATLSNLAISRIKNGNSSTAILTPAFNSTTHSYSIDAPNGTSVITLTPTASDARATIKVNGAAVTSGTVSADIKLNVGLNTITTIVTAQDGVTTDTYTVTIDRRNILGQLDGFNEPISVNQAPNPQLEGDGIVVHQGVSPNGDGINDVFTIDGLTNYPDNKVTIMNRNGAVVYQAQGYDNSTKVFDGHSNINGAMQLPGTYFYSLEYKVAGDTKRKTGFIILKY